MPPRRQRAVVGIPAGRRRPGAADLVPQPQAPPPAQLPLDEDNALADRSQHEIDGPLMEPQPARQNNSPEVRVQNDRNDNISALEEEERSPFNNDLILSKIFSYLDTSTLKNCHLVNRQWSTIVPPILSRRVIPVFLTTDIPERRHDHRLESFQTFQEIRQRPTWRDGGVKFTNFRLNFKNYRSKIVDVLQTPWAASITELHIEGLGPEDYNYDAMHAFLESLPQLRRLEITLKKFHGTDLVIHQWASDRALLRNTSWTSDLDTLVVRVLGSSANLFQWRFLHLCSNLKSLVLDVDENFRRLPQFFSGIIQQYQGETLIKLSLKYCWASTESFHTFLPLIRSLPILDLELDIQLDSRILISALDSILKGFKKLSLKLIVYGDRDLENISCFSKLLNCLHSPQYAILEELVLSFENYNFLSGNYRSQLVEVLPLVGVKKLVVRNLLGNRPQRIDKKLMAWIVKQIPSVFPNLESLETDICSVGSLKKLLKDAKSLNFLRRLTINAPKSFKLRQEHLFGKSQRRSAYHGFCSLELTHLTFVLPKNSAVTAQELCQGFSRMVTLQELTVKGITVDPVADQEAIQRLKSVTCLRYLNLSA